MIYTDNKDFYPTPQDLFYQLMNGKRYILGKILEPSAGKGDLINHIQKLNGRDKANIDAIESDSRLVNILQSNNINVVWDDFLTYKTFKEYDFIVMNPPFSNGVDHALKAIELAENQISRCEIYIILNKETIDNAYSNKRKELLQKLECYNADIRYVQDGFVDAERKTNVEVALINLTVPEQSDGQTIYDKIKFNFNNESKVNELETALSTHVKQNDIQAKLNDIERLVLEYETACELAKKAFKINRDKSLFFSYIGEINKKDGEIGSPFSYVIKNEVRSNDLNDELDRLRREYWQLILDTDEFKKLLTNEAIQKLNRQMEIANEMEINLVNIQMLLFALGANQQDILIDSIVSIFKKITKYHMNDYSSNIHYYNGWKTNDAYKINKKIIIPISYSFDRWDFNEHYDRINREVRYWINDIIKALQLLDNGVKNEFEYIGNNSFENNWLRFKMFLNGNIHVWFKNLKLLNELNYLCGQHFNWIPSDGEQKTNEEAREFVVKEFGDIGDVKLITN